MVIVYCCKSRLDYLLNWYHCMLRWLLTVKNGSACLCMPSLNTEAHMLGRCTNHVISILTLLLLRIFALIFVFIPCVIRCVTNFIAYMQYDLTISQHRTEQSWPCILNAHFTIKIFGFSISVFHNLNIKNWMTGIAEDFMMFFLLCAPQMVCLKGCIAKQSLTCLQLP